MDGGERMRDPRRGLRSMCVLRAFLEPTLRGCLKKGSCLYFTFSCICIFSCLFISRLNLSGKKRVPQCVLMKLQVPTIIIIFDGIAPTNYGTCNMVLWSPI